MNNNLLTQFDLYTPHSNSYNLSLKEVLHKLSQYLATGADKFDLVWCMSGEIVNDYIFITIADGKETECTLADLLDLILYLNRFDAIVCDQLDPDNRIILWNK